MLHKRRGLSLIVFPFIPESCFPGEKPLCLSLFIIPTPTPLSTKINWCVLVFNPCYIPCCLQIMCQGIEPLIPPGGKSLHYQCFRRHFSYLFHHSTSLIRLRSQKHTSAHLHRALPSVPSSRPVHGTSQCM